ncbi:DUF4331 domain-containing protein [Candidatus Entotheonella palauensis]|uniref:DUF4331 domain-containing protein n=1 Tax=Candidatus Entotheonella palauensis TaxID=93172 RepID=UPI000B7E345F|nr:DUF4331 domain-containing protein [Candidatus Entotheonella palauensis]
MHRQNPRIFSWITVALAAIIALASSHREAPFITKQPKVDATDFYMFNSYEADRNGYVTVIANYQPLQDSYGGPNYFFLDPDALYEIHIDNNGDAVEDITFQFQFQNTLQDLTLDIGGQQVAVPVLNLGPIGPGATDTAALNIIESYTVNIVRGDRRSGTSQAITNLDTGASSFLKPVDNIGNKSIAEYDDYADNHIYNISIPGCEAGKMFVGQRDDPFVVNLGEVFDLINLNPIGDVDAESDIIADANVTSFILEIPAACLTAEANTVIGGWTTASLRQARVLNPAPSTDPAEHGASVEGGAWTQVSRLANPLVNEVVIGLQDKDRFNASEPVDDAQFATYVTHPTLPEIIEILFGAAGVQAPTAFPRNDLVQVFLSGVPDLNATPPALAEIMRLDTSTPPVPAAMQNNLGVIAMDPAGYPNGRRPGDDVVDISLRVVMGYLLSEAEAPSGMLPYTDGALVNASMFDETFPYIRTPHPGSPTP